MKKIGLIGGMGPESTVDYYQRIIKGSRRGETDFTVPEIIIYSVNTAELFHIINVRDTERLVDWLVERVESLAGVGADFAAITANTPHIVFNAVARRSPIPLISIVEATLANSQSLGLKKVALLGTKLTMESDFYQQVFIPAGITVHIPTVEQQDYIHRKLMTEIEFGIINRGTRRGLLTIISRMKEVEGIDGVILGCTELPLILDRDEFGLPFLNTTAIHVDAIVRYAMDGRN